MLPANLETNATEQNVINETNEKRLNVFPVETNVKMLTAVTNETTLTVLLAVKAPLGPHSSSSKRALRC